MPGKIVYGQVIHTMCYKIFLSNFTFFKKVGMPKIRYVVRERAKASIDLDKFGSNYAQRYKKLVSGLHKLILIEIPVALNQNTQPSQHV